MSGWIKFEKAVTTDVRYRRYSREVARICNALALPSSFIDTLASGALLKLWLYADEHIREDDTLRASLDDIDEVMGIKGIANILPSDWLQVIDPDNVKLPDFLAHNGSVAKKLAMTQKRVARHRQTIKRNAKALLVQPDGNAPALTDQTRPDHTTLKRQSAQSHGSRLATDWTPDQQQGQYALNLGLDVGKTATNFREYWLATPGAKGRKADWNLTWQTWCRRDADRMTSKANGHDTEAARAWTELIDTRGAAKRTPRIETALRAIGGWSRISMRTDFDADKIKREFCNAYSQAPA